eukprot:4332209-Pyramimonas_sp.AAC.1
MGALAAGGPPSLPRRRFCVRCGIPEPHPDIYVCAYSGNPGQETSCFPPGCFGVLGFRWFCNGKRDVPTPSINVRPGVSRLGVLWAVSCGRVPIVRDLGGSWEASE